jgi:hypothetical protein
MPPCRRCETRKLRLRERARFAQTIEEAGSQNPRALGPQIRLEPRAVSP